MASMSSLSSRKRRRLLQAAGSAGLLAAAGRRLALAQSAADYKALVCIYLDGGNDGENTLVRYDSPGYQTYSAVRPPASGINIPQAQLLPVQPARGGPPFGFHPSCAELQGLFAQKKLAVIANMGLLARPSTRDGLLTGGAPRPANLFSHSDQMRSVTCADVAGTSRVGWGGRMVDSLDDLNGGSVFPAGIATDSWGYFLNGQTSIRLTVPPGATLRIPTTPLPQEDALAEATMRELLAQPHSNTYDNIAALLAEESLQASSVASPVLVNANSIVRPYFANLGSYVAAQLRTVALMIEGRAQIQLKRQVFSLRQYSYDTHGAQLGFQAALLADLSKATKAFLDAMSALGLSDSVTLFTLSDFGRTFKPAAGAGTDHGWGNYAFAVGGSVKGGDFYGAVPTMALNGPDDLGDAGRWIPTTALEQYGATLARWFGIAEADLPYVFPNIGAFPAGNLGFMA
jgi:uncharacterized protein (DUF1501 family)